MFIRTNGEIRSHESFWRIATWWRRPIGVGTGRSRDRARQHVSTVGASATSVPGEQQHSIGETTSGGHLALKGVRLLEREKL
jgi:hypothetical protein